MVLRAGQWVRWSSGPDGGSDGPPGRTVGQMVLRAGQWVRWSSGPDGGSDGPPGRMVGQMVLQADVSGLGWSAGWWRVV